MIPQPARPAAPEATLWLILMLAVFTAMNLIHQMGRNL